MLYLNISNVSNPVVLFTGGSPRLKIFRWELPLSRPAYEMVASAFRPAMHVENAVFLNRPRQYAGRLLVPNLKSVGTLEVLDSERHSYVRIITPADPSAICGSAGIVFGDWVEATARDERPAPFERIMTHLIVITKSSSGPPPDLEELDEEDQAEMDKPGTQ